MDTPNPDVPSCIALLAATVKDRDPRLQQLYCSLLRCQAELQAAALALQLHAKRNVRLGRESPPVRVCHVLA